MLLILLLHESNFSDIRRVSIKLIKAADLQCLKLITAPTELKGIAAGKIALLKNRDR
jgi:hypothetical protein